MDEIFTQKQFGVAISLLYVVSFIGYPISMLAGSVFLQYYVTFDPPEGVTFESKEWVGAWWMGMFFPAIAVFILSFFVLLYPRQMPAAKVKTEIFVTRNYFSAPLYGAFILGLLQNFAILSN